MVEWLRCSTRIHKIPCSNFSIIIQGMTLDKSLTAKLSRMTHSYRANASSVSTLEGRGADTTVRKKKKTVETGCMWILIITAAGPNERQASLWEAIINLVIDCTRTNLAIDQLEPTIEFYTRPFTNFRTLTFSVIQCKVHLIQKSTKIIFLDIFT